ncbi:MAG: hypothetical protein A3F67_06025 [Verrucomicrobia bacterium RIFCSPHIGHO2_12_FULL_41_10]|nr:MAG: hypothetical protein A3F67_06025 [Verrucomicrobia bacterium RIFCSPHIGHO2_12_FULL_41_10]
MHFSNPLQIFKRGFFLHNKLDLLTHWFSNFISYSLIIITCSLIMATSGTLAAPVKSSITSSSEPWALKRDISNFQALLAHSPFSLATAEESSPLSERYAVTGIVNIDGEEQVFVFDRMDQSRELVTKKPNSKSMALLNIPEEKDPNQIKVTIRVGEETGVISSMEPTPPQGLGPQRGIPQRPGYPSSPTMMPPGTRNNLRPGAMSRYPNPSQQYPTGYPSTYPGGNTSLPPSALSNPNSRRIIRRPVISPQGGAPTRPSSSSYPTSSYPTTPGF